MKKIIITAFAVILIAIPAAQAKTIGTVLSTDIGTVIDGAACKTYNVDGRTFVVAEDLRGYGFDVEWNESARLLTITQNPYAHRTLLTADEVNIKKEDCPVGNPVMDILATDITVTVAGEAVESYNIDGRMVIPVRALEPYAYVEYDDEKRLVKIKGLQHYLDERYNSGNPNVTQEIKEYSQRTLNCTYTLGWPGDMIDYERDGTVDYVDVKEVTTIDTENGNIYAYHGNPLSTYYPTGLYHFETCPDREIYNIQNSGGETLYDADVLPRQEDKMESLHIITYDYAQLIWSANRTDYLYGYTVSRERGYNNYWPSDEEINAPDIRFEKFAQNEYGSGVIAENGYLYKIEAYDDTERHLYRYNVLDGTVSNGFVISRDNVLFDMYDSTSLFDSYRKNSLFDRVIAYNIKKAVRGKFASKYYMINTNRELYYMDEKLATDALDVVRDGNDYIYLLTSSGELYEGTHENYQSNTQSKVASYIKYVTSSSGEVYFINENDEVYLKTNNKWGKVADNIKKVVDSALYVTTDGVLTNLNKEYATDVKDAYRGSGVIYIIKTDGTLWYYKDGELARVKAFE